MRETGNLETQKIYVVLNSETWNAATRGPILLLMLSQRPDYFLGTGTRGKHVETIASGCNAASPTPTVHAAGAGFQVAGAHEHSKWILCIIANALD